MCVIDSKKAFDKVKHEEMQQVLTSLPLPVDGQNGKLIMSF